jgi:hypothetical protein
MILHVTKARLVRPFSLDLWFNDGTCKRVNLRHRLQGPVFRPLRDPAWFARVRLDRIGGTVVWPNGADFAPEYLHGLPGERRGGTRRANAGRLSHPAAARRR